MKLLNLIFLFISSGFVSNFFATKIIRTIKRMALCMKKEKISNLSVPNKMIKPKGVNQKIYTKYLENAENTIIIAYGPAGTGKTMFACLKAINMLKNGETNKIIITRPIVPVDEELGFLPGNILKKMDPWTRPMFDIFLEHYTKTELDNLLHNNIIEISPLAYMRGRTFKRSFIIADEMQNSSPKQMLMLLTRIGEESRMVVTGDLKQSDKMENNGLMELVNKLNNYNTYYNVIVDNEIKIVELNTTDVERSKVVKKIIDIYSNKYTEKIMTLKENNLQRILNLNVSGGSIVTNTSSPFAFYYDKYNNDAALIPKMHPFRKIWEI